MPGLLVTNARVVGADAVLAPGWISTSGGVIDGMGAGFPDSSLVRERSVVDAAGATVLPGFVDVHVHGAVGVEVMDGDAPGLTAMSAFFARHGVTSFLATTWTAPTEETLRALHAVAEVTDIDLPGARILGAHMEGPYLNDRRCGAQDPRSLRAPDLAELRRFLDTGVIRLITVAPELAGARELVATCRGEDVRVSAGHTEATYEQMVEAAAWGIAQVTHTFNAMPSLHHRRPGVVGAAMTLPRLAAELIADNQHVHPVVLAALLRAKGPDGVILVTDALRPTGLESETFLIGGRPAHIANGVVRLDDGTMAGSVLTMDVALRNLATACGVPFEELWPTSSRNGAIAAGVGHRKGSLAIGMDADLVVVGDDVDVRMTVVGGRVVHTAPIASPVP
jgi:N-acetylglucosamine-6-phosphate deacetylase